MNESAISKFSLTKLTQMAGLHRGDLFFNGCLVAPCDDNDGHDHTAREILRYPTRIDAVIILLLIEGSGKIYSGVTPYRIDDGMLYIHLPDSIIHAEFDYVKSAYVIACDTDSPNRFNMNFGMLSEQFIKAREYPAIKLAPEELREIRHSIDELFKEKDSSDNDAISDNIMYQLITTTLLRVSRVVDRRIRRTEASSAAKPRSRNEEYFIRFIDELSHNYSRHRSVDFYAERLHITPKYLTTMIRKVSGRPASEWIGDQVVLEAKNLLKYSTMSIQEIAYALNFPNQSFFGRYFKNHTGKTPSAYRNGRQA